jgi:hypothetical protein
MCENVPQLKVVVFSWGTLKGQSHLSFWKIKLVLSAGPLMVLTFFYFVVPEIPIQIFIFKLKHYENTY